jgi:hypothetical protein
MNANLMGITLLLMKWLLRVGMLSLFSTIVLGADRALIMTVSEYPRAPLPGASRDQDNARQILSLLDVSLDNVRSVRDGALSAAGIKSELAQLAADTQSGDRVFIFFSGHGSSRLIDGRCQQALVGHDLDYVNPADITSTLAAIKDKAAKVVMVIDACHSGGVVADAATRSLTKSRFRAKFLDADNPEERCAKPANVIEERIGGLRSAKGIPVAGNYLYLAAAQANEVAFDDEVAGGLATSSLLACLKGGVPDLDQSGAVSFSELAQCAQQRIDGLLTSDPVNRPHHIALAGNRDLPIVSKAAPTTSAPAADPVATLRDLANAADSRWSVRVDATPPRARIGKDAFRLTVTSSQDGYLSLLYVGSDGKEFLQLYPEAPGQQVPVKTGQVFRIPGEFAAGGPAGTNRVLAIVSASPRDYSAILGQQGAAAATMATARALQESTRNLKHRLSKGELASYGATLIDLIEE